jgi:peptidoglycan/LPS O-acetylase OafA/YrhL
MNENPKRSLAYMPQLDTVRTVAVSMVIFSHWAGFHQNRWRDTFWFNGEVGVQLFFVLSGFLITGILLDERAKAVSANVSVKEVLKAFYVRRFLRIFPLFYATLLITYLLGNDDVRASIQWHIPYLSNFFFALRGDYLGDVSHFWSLAVEEQFYIFWPFLILFLRRRYLFGVIVGVILVAPLFSYLAAQHFGMGEVAVNVLPFSSLDALGMGALLALVARAPYQGQAMALRREHFFYFSAIATVAYVLLHTLIPVMESASWVNAFLARCMLAPALAGVVCLFSEGVRGRAAKLVQFPPLLYLGKISYGIYIWHFFIPSGVAALCYHYDFLLWEKIGVFPYLILNLTLLIAVCSISWHFFEKPINDLKRFVPYTGGFAFATAKVKNLFYKLVR